MSTIRSVSVLAIAVVLAAGCSASPAPAGSDGRAPFGVTSSQVETEPADPDVEPAQDEGELGPVDVATYMVVYALFQQGLHAEVAGIDVIEQTADAATVDVTVLHHLEHDHPAQVIYSAELRRDEAGYWEPVELTASER